MRIYALLPFVMILGYADLAAAQMPTSQSSGGAINQYGTKYKKTPPPADDGGLLLPSTYQIALMPSSSADQAVLRIVSPVAVNGCVTIKNPQVQEKYYGANIVFEIGQPEIQIDTSKRYAHYQCSATAHYTQIDLSLDMRRMKEDNVRQITLKANGPSDILDVRIEAGKFSLVPRTTRAFKPAPMSKGQNPLSLPVSLFGVEK